MLFRSNDKDFDSVLEVGGSSFDQKILSAQTLQAVANDEALEKQFEGLMTTDSTAGFDDARSKFIDATHVWIDKKSRSADPRLDRMLPDIIHDNLKKMADQFMLPDDFYAENFGFFKTVKGLVRSWGNKMIDRMGSPQAKQKLESLFKNLFGIYYPAS